MISQEIHLEVKDVKNIKSCQIDISFEKGMYAFVGTNGCGKSTLMNVLALLVRPSSLRSLDESDYDGESLVKVNIDETEDILLVEGGLWCSKDKSHGNLSVKNLYKGFYEGSIFYGTRFYDYQKVESLKNTIDVDNDLRPADEFVINSMSDILHGDFDHYKDLYKIKNKQTAQRFGLKGIPYFFKYDGKLISQYRMSSGECMLLSLIDFFNNLAVRGVIRARRGEKVLFLIDEVELALHPSAIDRLLKFFKDKIKESMFEIVVYFSTHSSEIIQKISPKNIYLLENNNGVLEYVNPCYANYAIRNLYVPNGFDYLVLVEDDLARCLVNKLIRSESLCSSKLVCVLPGGGWSQLLRLHYDIANYNVLGVGKKIVSIYDGDVKSDVEAVEKLNHLPKCFLPVKSIEKFLLKKLVSEQDGKFLKLIGDKYFTQKSLIDIVKDYKKEYSGKDKNGKRLYQVLITELKENKINEDEFVNMLCDDIISYEDLAVRRFAATLTSMLS